MATLASSAPTLIDVAKRVDPDGKVPTIVELLAQTNEVLADMPWFEGNLPTGHRTTVRTGIPAAAWRKLNGGVAESKSTTAQIDETCGMLEAWGKADKDLVELNGNTAAFRLSEARAFMEAMNQTMASTLFYGDTTVNPERFLGLAPRFASLSGAANSQNIVNAGGSGSDNASIWLVVWGDQTVHGIYPKGSKAGLVHEDLGLDTVLDANSNPYRAYRDRFQWKCGVAVKDWRYIVRIANIDISNLVAESSAADLTKLMIKAIHRLPNGPSGLRMGRAAWYATRSVREMLDIQALNKASSQLTVDNFDGQYITRFRGIPIRTVDALLETETALT